MSRHVLQMRPSPTLCLALLLGSCARPAGESVPIDEANEGSEGRQKLLSAIQDMVRLEYTIFRIKDEKTYSRLGPIIVDSPEDVERIRELLSGSLGAVRRNSMPFGEIMLEFGQGTYITTVDFNLQTKRLRLQVTKYLEFFQDERWTAELSNGSFYVELRRIAIEQSQMNPRLIMNVERGRVPSGENSN
jgi:hypothetical protein